MQVERVKQVVYERVCMYDGVCVCVCPLLQRIGALSLALFPLSITHLHLTSLLHNAALQNAGGGQEVIIYGRSRLTTLIRLMFFVIYSCSSPSRRETDNSFSQVPKNVADKGARCKKPTKKPATKCIFILCLQSRGAESSNADV